MHMHFKKNIIFLFILVTTSAIAQTNFCGMNKNNSEYAAKRAQSEQKEINLNNLAYQYLQQNVGNVINGSTVEIPIVFHIIHQNGPENIADSVVMTEVMRLNQRFNTGMFNYADGVNVNIQFCWRALILMAIPQLALPELFHL